MVVLESCYVTLVCIKKTDCLGLDSMTRHYLNEVIFKLLLNPNNNFSMNAR